MPDKTQITAEPMNTLVEDLGRICAEKLVKKGIADVNKARKKAGATSVRDSVAPGTYQIDQLVRLTGTVTVGEDYEQHIVQAMAPVRLLALALNKLNGVTLEALVAEAEKLDPKNLPEGVSSDKDIKARVVTAMEKLKGKTLKACKGKITIKDPEVIVEELTVA